MKLVQQNPINTATITVIKMIIIKIIKDVFFEWWRIKDFAWDHKTGSLNEGQDERNERGVGVQWLIVMKNMVFSDI